MSLRARCRRWMVSPTAAVVVLLLGCYGYFYQAGGWNQNSRMDLVRAVVEDGSLKIDRFEKNTGDDSRKDGHFYCDKAPGAQWLCTPTYAAIYYANGAPAQPGPHWLAWAVWFTILVAIAIPTIVATVFLMRVVRVLGASTRAAWTVALAWALGTMAFPYSTLLYGNQLAGSLLITAFALFVEIRHGVHPPTRLRMAIAGGLVGLALATEYPAALIAIPVVVYALWFLRRPCLWAALGGAVPLLALAWYHDAAFGSPGAFPYDYSVWKEPHTGFFMGIGVPNPRVLLLLLGGDYRGLLFTTPWLALGLPGAVMLGFRRFLGELVVCAVSVVLFFWLNASIPPWHGGWAAGPRYLVPCLPFAAVLAGGAWVFLFPAVGASRLRAGLLRRIVVGILVVGLAYSAFNMFAVTAVKPEIDVHQRHPYSTYVWPKFVAGELSVSRQSIDMLENPKVGPFQAWNLGMKLGLFGHVSLVPLYLWIVACVIWLLRTLRLRPVTPAPEPEPASG